MKKKFIITILCVICMVLLAVSISAAAPTPAKPDLGVDFGDVSTIENFTPPSQLYGNTTERVLLTDGNGNYVTYPTYYVTKDSATFDFSFDNLNTATGITYKKSSVVMLEIPKGVTTITASYFSGTGNFPLCVSVQFPGTVTSYGASLFQTNSVIKSVEFLDGTEPITMGNSMFGSNWAVGTTNIQYVKFPNNLTSIGNSTFGKAKGGVSKIIIFGENLESIGTGFFGESTPSSTDTFMYVSDNFFTETAVFSNLFGSEAPYHGNNLMLTMFYTGTQAQAEELVAKGLAVQTGYVWDANKVKIVSASDYDYSTHKPTSSKSITIAYDYNVCDAFYNGVHKYDDSNPCVKACLNCGIGTKEHNDSDAELVSITYPNGYSNEGEKHITCSNEGCILDLTEKTKPLFETKGYSTPENGRGDIVISFIINYDEIAEYEKSASTSLKYGVFAIAYDKIGESDIMTNDNTICVEVENYKYISFEMRISGFETNTQKNAKLSIGAYVTDSNGESSYLQAAEPKDGESFHYITYNDIYTSTLD